MKVLSDADSRNNLFASLGAEGSAAALAAYERELREARGEKQEPEAPVKRREYLVDEYVPKAEAPPRENDIQRF